jgi:hypothetical protein
VDWALVGLVLLSVGLRLVPVLFQPSLNWWDEIFQATEQAHRVVYGTGLVPWEFQLGVRSWLLPGVIAFLMELARIAGEGPDIYLPVIAVAFAALGAAPVVCCVLWCRKFYGYWPALAGGVAVAVMPDLVYFGARTLTEVVAGHLLVVALYVLQPCGLAVSSRRAFVGGMLLALVFVLRVQLAPVLALVAAWTAISMPRGTLAAIFGGLLVVVTLSGALDTITVGYPLGWIWHYVLYNAYFGVSSTFGVESWSFYGLGELGLWRGGTVAVIALALLGAQRLPLSLVAAAIIVVVHSAIPHKEYRFIYPAIQLGSVLVGVGLARVVAFMMERLRVRGVRDEIAGPVFAVLAGSYWCVLSFQVWAGPTMTALRDRAHDRLMAAHFVSRMPTICGIGLYGSENAWVWSGGYTYLDRSVPIYWPDDEAKLHATAPGFDTIIFWTRPAEDLGFVPVRCFGEACVGRRPGGCHALPMMPMPFPKPLEHLRPTPPKAGS